MFQSVPAGRYDIEVECEGWVAANVYDIEYNGRWQSTTINLFELGSVHFRVQDEGGKSVPDAIVILDYRGSDILLPLQSETGDDGTTTRQQLKFPLEGVSDTSGLVRFRGLPPGSSYWVTAIHEEHAMRRIHGIELEAGQERVVDVIMPAGAFLSGVVAGYDGRPVESARVFGFRPFHPVSDPEIEVDHAGKARSRGWMQESGVLTDSAGRFTIGPLPPGLNRIRIEKQSDGWLVLTKSGVDAYLDWAERNEHGDRRALRLTAQTVLAPGERRDLGVLRPEYPPVEVVLVCNGFEQPNDLIVSINPMIDRSRAESTVELISAHGTMRLAAGNRDRVVFENVPPCRLSVTVKSASNATKLYSGRAIEGVGGEPKAIYVELEQASPPVPTVDVVVIPDPVPEMSGYFSFALIQPVSNSHLRYGLGQLPQEQAAGIVNSAAHSNRPLFTRLEAKGAYTLWMTNGQYTIVETFDLTGRGAEGTIEVRPSLSNVGGACQFHVTDESGSPVKDAVVEWFWDVEHFEQVSHRPYLRESTNDEGVALVRGFPAAQQGFISDSFLFRVRAAGFKSKAVRTAGGTAGTPSVETVRLERR